MRFALFRFLLPHQEAVRRDTPTGPHRKTSIAIGSDAGANDVGFKPASALTDANIAADAQRTSQSVKARAGFNLNGAEWQYAKFRRRELFAALRSLLSQTVPRRRQFEAQPMLVRRHLLQHRLLPAPIPQTTIARS